MGANATSGRFLLPPVRRVRQLRRVQARRFLVELAELGSGLVAVGRIVANAINELEPKVDFDPNRWTSYDECRERVAYFKNWIENRDGYKLLNRKPGESFDEKGVQLAFGLTLYETEFDFNREPNNGRGSADYTASYGSRDKSLIEFKLGSNKKLKRNLEKQVAIYEAANGTRSSLKVIVCYTARQQAYVAKILEQLDLRDDDSIFVIDARNDNKPSAVDA